MAVNIFKENKKKWLKVALMAGGFALLVAPLASGINSLIPQTGATAHASANDAYDISEWQGWLTPNEVKNLKREVGFVILRAQNGGLENDSQFAHNVSLMKRYHVPYGVYSYSLYANAPQARQEADALHRRAPNAKFYVNDIETNNAGSDLNYATYAWSKEMHKDSNRPDVLYSGLYNMSNNFTQSTRNQYNAIWVAAYGSAEPDPAYHYDLWQFTDSHYSRALGRALDESTFPDGNNKPLSFWIGGGGNAKKANKSAKQPKRSDIVPLNPASKKAIDNANQAATAKINKAQRKARYYKNQAKKNANQVSNLQQRLIKAQNENKLESQTIQNDKSQIKNLQGQLTKDQQQISLLKHKKFNVGPQHAINKPSRKAQNKARKHKVAIKGSGKVDPQYYSSKNCHYLEVTNPGGIELYNKRTGQKMGHVPQGMVLNVNKFIKVHHHGKTITKAVGVHWGQADIFTSNRNYVSWY